LGFSLADRYLKRAGLDYWHLVDVRFHASLAELWAGERGRNFHLLTTKGGRRHSEAAYGPDDLLIFGKETAGLPDELLTAHPGRCIRIPMRKDARSLNLSNAVAVVVYEALRQTGYEGLL
jgi:tRNA (cytidine/uridine-2'-O-)-methyltransferase